MDFSSTGSDNSNSFLVQLEIYQDFRNLQFNPKGSHKECEQQARRLFDIYADPKGSFMYYDLQKQGIVGVRSSEVDGIRLEAFNDKQPVEGILVIENLLESLSLRG